MWRVYLEGELLGKYFSERNAKLAVLAYCRYRHRDPKDFIVLKVK